MQWNQQWYPIQWRPHPNGFWVDNWFSNMSICSEPLRFREKQWPTVEHAYQAAKFTDPFKIEAIHREKGGPGAKKIALSWTVETPKWEIVRLEIMWELLLQKWSQPAHAQQLLQTEGLLVEWNNWNDRFWGIAITTEGKVLGGTNYLGIFLTAIRELLRAGYPLRKSQPSDQMNLF